VLVCLAKDKSVCGGSVNAVQTETGQDIDATHTARHRLSGLMWAPQKTGAYLRLPQKAKALGGFSGSAAEAGHSDVMEPPHMLGDNQLRWQAGTRWKS
jgi:hypothetical protein